MKVFELKAVSNQHVLEHRSKVRLAEPVEIPDGCLGLVVLDDELSAVGVEHDSSPVLLPGKYDMINLRKHFPTSYRITSTTDVNKFFDLAPVVIGKVILVKAVD